MGPRSLNLPRFVGVEGETRVNETEKADDGGGEQHVGVETQPGKVQADLYPEVIFNVV